MKITLRKIVEVCNSEGEIIIILKETKSDTLYIMGKTNNGRTKIITKTNHFQISLYLQSRISLKELFLMNHDTHYFLITRDKAEAVFFEIKPNNLPPEIQGLECGNELYHFIPPSMRNVNLDRHIDDLLPEPVSREKTEQIGNTILNLGGIDFFNSAKSPIHIVSIESDIHNPDQHDYLLCPTQYGKEDVMVKINPYVLFLFLHNRLSVTDVYKCRMDDFFIVHDGDNFYRTKYNSYIESLLLNFGRLNQTYYSLAPTMRIDGPMELYKHYINYQTSSGKGILEPGFLSSFPIDVKIINNR